MMVLLCSYLMRLACRTTICQQMNDWIKFITDIVRPKPVVQCWPRCPAISETWSLLFPCANTSPAATDFVSADVSVCLPWGRLYNDRRFTDHALEVGLLVCEHGLYRSCAHLLFALLHAVIFLPVNCHAEELLKRCHCTASLTSLTSST